MTSGAPNIDLMNPKTALNHICQRYKQCPVTRDDVEYFTVQTWAGSYKSTVTLHCLSGQRYTGDPQITWKDAEKSAAEKAVAANRLMLALLPAALSRDPNRKKKGPTYSAAELVGLHAEDNENDDRPPLADNRALTPKVRLNALCMKIMHNFSKKGDSVYECNKVVGGFQGKVRLPCLPGRWSTSVWAGEVRPTKQQAEQSAAEIALWSVGSDQRLMRMATEGPDARRRARAAGAAGQIMLPDRVGLQDPQDAGFDGRGAGGGRTETSTGSSRDYCSYPLSSNSYSGKGSSSSNGPASNSSNGPDGDSDGSAKAGRGKGKGPAANKFQRQQSSSDNASSSHGSAKSHRGSWKGGSGGSGGSTRTGGIGKGASTSQSAFSGNGSSGRGSVKTHRGSGGSGGSSDDRRSGGSGSRGSGGSSNAGSRWVATATSGPCEYFDSDSSRSSDNGNRGTRALTGFEFEGVRRWRL